MSFVFCCLYTQNDLLKWCDILNNLRMTFTNLCMFVMHRSFKFGKSYIYTLLMYVYTVFNNINTSKKFQYVEGIKTEIYHNLLASNF